MNTIQPGGTAPLEAGGMYQVTNNSNQTGNYTAWESDPSLGEPYSIPASGQQTLTGLTSPVKTATYWFMNSGSVPLELQAITTIQPGGSAPLEAGATYQVTNNSNQAGSYSVGESDPPLMEPYSIPASSQQSFTCLTSPVKTATYSFANMGPVPLGLQAT